MKDGYGYLNEEELEALIAEVEKTGLITPPVYLKGLIMEAAAGEEMPAEDGRENARGEMVSEKGREAVPTVRHVKESRGMAAKSNPARMAKVQFWLYSFKIAAAAAAAIFCLTTVPMDITGENLVRNDRIERQIEKDVERYQEEKIKALEEEENTDPGWENMIGGRWKANFDVGGDGLWDGLTNWLGMEE